MRLCLYIRTSDMRCEHCARLRWKNTDMKVAPDDQKDGPVKIPVRAPVCRVRGRCPIPGKPHRCDDFVWAQQRRPTWAST